MHGISIMATIIYFPLLEKSAENTTRLFAGFVFLLFLTLAFDLDNWLIMGYDGWI